MEKKTKFSKFYNPNHERQVILSLQLANYLMEEGFNVIEIDFHRYKPNHLIYVFENSPELHDAMDNYKRTKELQNN